MYKIIAAIGIALIVFPFVYDGGVLFKEYSDVVVGLGVVALVASFFTYYESNR